MINEKGTTRRNFLRRITAGTAALAVGAGPFFLFPERALAARRTLNIAKWAHFVPEFDLWFEEIAKEWGKQQDITVTVEHIPVEQIWALAQQQVRNGQGHDIFMFPWPPAEFQRHVVNHREIYDQVSFSYGSIPQIAHRSTFDPRTKQHFAFADFWVPAPLHYFEDFWAEANMPLGPVHYGSLRSGGQRIRNKLGVPCGLDFAPTLEGNITSNTLFYAFRGQILDPQGNVAINRNAFTKEALKYVKTLCQDAGAVDEFTWKSCGNQQAMLSRKASCTTNAISLLRAAEKTNPEVAKKIRLQPPLLGPYGVTAFPHATNCSVVWKFAQNQDTAKQFLIALVEHSRTGYEKSLGCNFPTYPKALPNLVVQLENDPHADPPYKYSKLKDALHWTPNFGAPGFASPVWMEAFNTFVIPRMFARVVQGRLSVEDAAAAAEKEVTSIAEKWRLLQT